MSAFAAAIATLFSDGNMAEDAEWWPAGASAGTAIRAIFAEPTAEDDIFGQAVARPSLVAWIPNEHAVAQGDRIKRGGAFYPVRDVPSMDGRATRLRCALGPAGAS